MTDPDESGVFCRVPIVIEPIDAATRQIWTDNVFRDAKPITFERLVRGAESMRRQGRLDERGPDE